MENIKKYKFVYRQENLQYLYESAIKRMEAHPEYAAKRIKIIQDYPYYESEKDALEAAFRLSKDDMHCCVIWAKIEKDEEYYRINTNYCVVTYTSEEIKAAEYIGMAALYNASNLFGIIHDNINIDDLLLIS
jgi:hypothetical protein